MGVIYHMRMRLAVPFSVWKDTMEMWTLYNGDIGTSLAVAIVHHEVKRILATPSPKPLPTEKRLDKPLQKEHGGLHNPLLFTLISGRGPRAIWVAGRFLGFPWLGFQFGLHTWAELRPYCWWRREIQRTLVGMDSVNLRLVSNWDQLGNSKLATCSNHNWWASQRNNVQQNHFPTQNFKVASSTRLCSRCSDATRNCRNPCVSQCFAPVTAMKQHCFK